MAKDFTFKQFHIKGFDCGMPVSTDAILLGAWANIQQKNSILDIGCGTGVLSIMCAQRNSLAQIIGVELDSHAVHAATVNYQNCPWLARLQAIHASITDLTQDYLERDMRVSAIICNPPYFNEGEVAAETKRAMARHTQTLSHQTLIDCCGDLLLANGTAHFVLPKFEGEQFIKRVMQSENSGLVLSRLLQIKTTVQKPVSRLLIELTKKSAPNEVINEELIIHQGEHYSADFISLTKDFYLKL